jgi:ketosteroid isomerase-like protein
MLSRAWARAEEDAVTEPADVVRRLYPALAAGDRETLTELLHPDFDGYFSPGLPAPVGGHHAGATSCIEQGWWAIGARWKVRAEPERYLDCAPGEVLVTGTYRGSGRASGRPVEAPFAHLWSTEGGRLRSLHQYTDTALWCAALED